MKKLKIILFILFIITLNYVVIRYIYEYILQTQANDNYYFYKIQSKHNFKEGLFYDALEDSNKSILKNKNNPNGYFLKIKSLIKLKNFKEAEMCIKASKSLCKEPNEIKKLEKLEKFFKEEKQTFENYLQKYDNAKNIQPFLTSISKNKVKIKNNDIFYNINGIRSIKATKQISQGKIIVEVPKNMLILSSEAIKFISEKYAKEDKKDYKEIENIINQCYNKKTFSLGLFLLENQNNDRFKEYLKIVLSNNYDSFPISFDEKTMELLKNTIVWKKVNVLKAKIDHDIDILYKIDSVKKYDRIVLKNIYNAVSSRNFGSIVNGVNEMLLCVWIDLVNHSLEKNTKWYFNVEKNSFCLEATKNIKKDEEIFDTYGVKKSNAHLLSCYGFTDHNNVKNSECEIEINGQFFTCRKNIDKEDEDNSLLLAINMLKNNNNKKEENSSKIKKEINIMKVLEDVCRKKLDVFSSTLDEDKNFFKENISKMTFNEINCFRVRIEEKEVLTWVAQFANNCIKVLSNYLNENDLVKFLQENKNIDDNVKKYLLSVFI